MKSIRLFALVATLSFTAAPALYAERAGTNPHPQPPPPTTFQLIAYTILSYFG